VLLVVKQASSKRCRSNFIVVLRLGARARLSPLKFDSSH
jgi:hypothetical protein